MCRCRKYNFFFFFEETDQPERCYPCQTTLFLVHYSRALVRGHQIRRWIEPAFPWGHFPHLSRGWGHLGGIHGTAKEGPWKRDSVDPVWGKRPRGPRPRPAGKPQRPQWAAQWLPRDPRHQGARAHRGNTVGVQSVGQWAWRAGDGTTACAELCLTLLPSNARSSWRNMSHQGGGTLSVFSCQHKSSNRSAVEGAGKAVWVSPEGGRGASAWSHQAPSVVWSGSRHPVRAEQLTCPGPLEPCDQE